jgi:23S rRNA (guanine2445-N2)-methyltransferase / 23S rRNA (guanine2069-N7)-methyltransferase
MRMLNLFAYTCSVSVAAAVGGAEQTTSVDLSNTYLDWGKRNFRLNGVEPSEHRFFRHDATRWIARNRSKFGWIFINPPTFSRSKTTSGAFNVHRDHTTLLEHAMRSLDDDGELLFTTHARQFELDAKLRRKFRVEDMTAQLVPPDFVRYPFQAFRLRR